MQAYSDVGSVIERARSLFSDAPLPSDAPVSAAASLDQGVVTTATSAEQMSELSGKAVQGHRSFAQSAVPNLTHAARSDTALAAQTQAAAQITQQGAARLGVLAERHQSTGPAAAAARPPAAQRAVLATLRSQAAQASDMVKSTQQQAAGIAAQVKTLSYKTGDPQAGPDDTIVGPRSGVQAVDFKQSPPAPQPPVPQPPTTGPPLPFATPRPGIPLGPPPPNPLDPVNDFSKRIAAGTAQEPRPVPPPPPSAWDKMTTPAPGYTGEDLQDAWAMYLGTIGATMMTLPSPPGWFMLLTVEPSFDQLLKTYGIP